MYVRMHDMCMRICCARRRGTSAGNYHELRPAAHESWCACRRHASRVHVANTHFAACGLRRSRSIHWQGRQRVLQAGPLSHTCTHEPCTRTHPSNRHRTDIVVTVIIIIISQDTKHIGSVASMATHIDKCVLHLLDLSKLFPRSSSGQHTCARNALHVPCVDANSVWWSNCTNLGVKSLQLHSCSHTVCGHSVCTV